MSFIPPDKINLEYEYNKKIPIYNELLNHLNEILYNAIYEEGIKTIKAVPRIKDFDEFYKKIIRYQITNDYFNKIDDIAGTRVVCVYYGDLKICKDLIHKKFIVLDHKYKTFDQRVDKTGYQSDHYIVKIPPESINDKDPLIDLCILDLKCEIQVRTALMHSWAVVSHDVNYKQEIKLSDEFDMEMYALSSLFFFADQRFDAYKKIRKEISGTPVVTLNLDQEITTDSLIEYFKDRFSSRPASDYESCFELSDQLKKFGYDSLRSVDKVITEAQPVLVKYEKDNPHSGMVGSLYSWVGATRIAVAIVNRQDKDSKSFYVKNIDEYRKLV